MHEASPTFLSETWSILLTLSPWLLLGALVAGLLHVLLPAGFIHRELSGRFSVLKAVTLGIPLPLCSCGVIPAALGLQRDGAGRGATVGFLISTPQTGVDSVLVSASFLGWPFALFKVAAAAITGLFGGTLAGALGGAHEAPLNEAASERQAPRSLRGLIEHTVSILRTIWHWIALGVIASAVITTWVPPDTLTGLGSLGSLLAVLAISIPLYVCATGSVPIAAALVASGLPTGSALVFLMAGPATNLATIGAVYRALGIRTLSIYLSTIVVGSLSAGLLFDSLLPTAISTMPHHQHGMRWWELGSTLILCSLTLWFALDELRSWLHKARAEASDTTSIEVSVDGMTCNGCRTGLEKALLNTPGVDAAVVILEPGSARVWGELDTKSLQQAIIKAGYTPGDADPSDIQPAKPPARSVVSIGGH